MSRAGRVLWATALLSLASFVYVAWLSGGELAPDPSLKPFDAHFTAYSADQGRAYLDALTPAARSVYLGEFRLWDTIFPALLAFTLCGVIWVRATGWRPLLRVAAMGPVVAYLAVDYMENAQVAQILQAGPALTDAMIERCGAYTQAKWRLLVLAFLTALWAGVFSKRDPQ